ncbi:MAG: GNAT family N-acetyltransferase [Planctomycetota bacterium]
MTENWQIYDALGPEIDCPGQPLPLSAVLKQILNLSSSVGIKATQQYIANCATQFLLVSNATVTMPLTVNDAQWDNCYVCSPFGAAIKYPLVELREIQSTALRAALSALIHSVAPLLRIARINRSICINNWMLSTNLYPDWDGSELSKLRDLLIHRYPKHAILLRSLNAATNEALIGQARDAGFLLAPSRQVYISTEPEAKFLRHQNCRWDRRLLDSNEVYSTVQHLEISESDDARIKELYDMLYLEKYTSLNPQFTTKLIKLWRETQAIRLTGLRNSEGELDGILGCFQLGGVLTAPLVGYDTSLPQDLGLYRMLMALMFKEASGQGCGLNLSSGAASFKRLRGGKPRLEYTAIYCDHLPIIQRRAWRSLAFLLARVGGPVLRKFEL